MKAVLCRQWGPPQSLVVEEVPSPTPAPGEVVLAVKAAGVNFPDLLIIQNKYQFKPALPFSPGSEVAGIVKAVGEGVRNFRPGDRVIAILGWGGFAEEVRAEEWRLAPMPEGASFETAAAFGLTYATALHALADRAQLAPGETLLVLGAAGGVGLAAIEIGKILGARVIAAASTAAKLATCREHGADALIDYEREDLREALRAATNGRGADVVFDPVGGKYTEPALRSTAWNGRYLVVGFAAGEIPRLPLNLVLLKGCAAVGVFWGEFARRAPRANAAHLATLSGWLKEGKIRPLVSATYSLARAAEALAEIAARRAQGKIVLTLN